MPVRDFIPLSHSYLKKTESNATGLNYPSLKAFHLSVVFIQSRWDSLMEVLISVTLIVYLLVARSVSYLSYGHGVWQIFLVGQNHNRNTSQLFISQYPLQGLLGLWHSDWITTVHYKNQSLTVVQVVPEEVLAITLQIQNLQSSGTSWRITFLLVDNGWEVVSYIYLQLGLILFCPPTSHTVREVFLSRSKVPTLNPMVGDVSITLKLQIMPECDQNSFTARNYQCKKRPTCPVSSLASRVDFPDESKPMRITWTHK